MENEPEYVTVGEAAELLGVDRRRIRRLIERGQLATRENPLDLREKLVSRAQLMELAKYARPAKKGAA